MKQEISFADKVRKIVSKIPRGRVSTYKEVARAAGQPNAARAVGTIMKNNYNGKVPCHRVVRSDGVIGDYNRGGTKAKKALLIQEGAFDKAGNLRFTDNS